MADAANRNNTLAEDECSYQLWLEGYLEQLEGKVAWEEFRERHFDTPEYYELVLALMG
jgi:hypothetical protein